MRNSRSVPPVGRIATDNVPKTCAKLSDGGEDWTRKDDGRLSCRPVRLVALPSLG
jgi:hypothetical protein